MKITMSIQNANNTNTEIVIDIAYTLRLYALNPHSLNNKVII